MNETEQNDRRAKIADFRYQLVAELANPYLKAAERQRLILQKAAMEHEVPGLGRRRLSASCIRKWLALYRSHGRAGLDPRHRRDIGVARSLSPAEAALLLNYLESNPSLTATAVLRTLQADGRITADPSSSSLSRLVRRAGMDRTQRLRAAQDEKNLKFDFFSPLECVQADCMYTLKLPDSKGVHRVAILLAFLDDATRRVVYATFRFAESSVAFEQGVKHILAAHGRIGRLYCDNGGPFVGMQTKRILDALGVIISHSRVGKPSGRGKLERFFRTAREQFFRPLDPRSLKSLQDLEQRFHSWLESEYHRAPHRGLEGATPLERWIERAHLIIPLDPTLNLQELFLHEDSRKVHKDSTITLDGVLFEVPSTLIGRRISFRYDPSTPPARRRLELRDNGQTIGEARRVDSYANAHVKRGSTRKELQLTDVDHTVPPPPATRRPVDNSLSASRLDLPQQEQP
ncbi:MAG: integrase core domain-containing protein [Elusimicrobiota bacterium]